MRSASLIVVLLFASGAHAADDMPQDMMLRFNDLAQRAETTESKDGPEAAIRLYESALEGWANNYGRVHLRLGQLHQKLGQTVSAAAHFRECMEDERVDALDRDFICKQGFREATVALVVDGLPEGSRLVVLEPRLFAREFTSGDRLPAGAVKIVVEAPGRRPQTSTVQLSKKGDEAVRWVAQLGLKKRSGGMVPDGFVSGEGEGEGEDLPPRDEFIAGEEVEPPSNAIRWPAYTAAGVGLAMVGAGLTLGFMNRGELDDIRSKQREGGCSSFCGEDLATAQNTALTADVIWMSGSAVAASSVLWWFLFEDAGEPVE